MAHPLAGTVAPADLLIDPAALEKLYYATRPDPGDPGQRVAFGTSGHRGTPGQATFTESHILAITQAICDYRKAQGIHGPLYLGKDTHAVSRAAEQTAMEVLGPYANLMQDERAPWGGRWAKQYLYDRSLTIAGGTSEVQRNIVAQRILGLPRR